MMCRYRKGQGVVVGSGEKEGGTKQESGLVSVESVCGRGLETDADVGDVYGCRWRLRC